MLQNRAVESIRKARTYLLEGIKDLSIEQLNRVPTGFNNNIIWNLGHLIAAQQGICYTRAGLPTIMETSFTALYKPGTRPDSPVDLEGYLFIRENLFSSLSQFEADYNKRIFTGYTSFTTRYGVTLSNIDEALEFLLFHEGLHTGHIQSLKCLVA